jgi:hypothetical protein
MELMIDFTTILILPVPDLFNKVFTAEIMARFLLLLPQLLLNNTLSSDTSVITSGKPECFMT